jgi:hypothetical protein
MNVKRLLHIDFERDPSPAMKPPPRRRRLPRKFDAVLAGKAQFTTQEQASDDLFRSEACAPPPLVLLIGLAPAR